MNTSGKIFSGMIWTTLQTIINRSFGFVIKLFLARILFPEDYGLVGMAVVFTSFVAVFNDLGMGAALVQRRQDELREEHYHTAFWTGVFTSILVFLIVSFGVAPFAAWFYEEPMLKKIIPVLSVGILASPVNLVHRAQLTKSLNFKKLAIINNAGSIFSGILALILALLGAGVWSLVFNSVSAFIIAMPLYFKATGWTPKFIWEKDSFKDIFGFGIYTTGTQLFNRVTGQIDYLLVGKLIGSSYLGIYSFAFILTDTFRSQITGILGQVMYPIYAELQNDPKKLSEYFLKVIRYNALIIYPIMVMFIIFSKYMIPLIFGIKWQDSVVIVEILSVSVMIHMLVNSNTQLIRAYGKAKLELRMQFIKSIFLFVPLITLGTINYGIIGTAIGFTLAKFLGVLIAIFITRRLFSMSYTDFLKAIATPLLISFIPGFLSFLLLYLNILWPYVLIFYIVAVLGLTLLLAKSEIRTFTNLLRNYAKKSN